MRGAVAAGRHEGKGETELTVILNLDGSVLIGAENANWSSDKGQKYAITYILNGNSYSGGTTLGVGDTGDGKKSFVGKFDADILDDLAKAKFIAFYRGETLVDSLLLDGSGAGLAVARRCLAAMKRDRAAAEAEHQRFADRPDDPFASAPSPANESDPKPTNTSVWVNANDYPPDALRVGAEGRATVKLEIAADGTVSACEVTNSTGNASLDLASCRLVQSRARFRPAHDTRGAAVAGKYSTTIRWSLPD